MKNFRRLAVDLDVQPVLSVLAQHPEWWAIHTQRQDYPGSAHADTRSIWLRGPRELTQAGVQQSLDSMNYPGPREALEPELRPLLEVVERHLYLDGVRECGRVLLAELRAGGFITTHSDEGVYAEHFDRYHLCLSGESCAFVCGGEAVAMQPGELWWFNHRAVHTLANYGPVPRVHLIVDGHRPT